MSKLQFDPTRSRASFTVHPWLHTAMTGSFAAPTGTLDQLANDRWRIDFSLQAASAAFPDSQRITAMLRSDAFFDAARHPIVHFRSKPFPTSVVRGGGTFSGVLDLHGVSKPVEFVFGTAGCKHPGVDCPIHVTGRISRYAFGMTRYKLVVRDEVDIAVDVRLRMLP